MPEQTISVVPYDPAWPERFEAEGALRADTTLAEEYEALKLRLADEHGAGVGGYTVGKRGFVVRVLRGQGIELGAR